MEEYKAFTCSFSQISKRLTTQVKVSSQFCKSKANGTWTAVWDTGATMTCISSNIVRALELIQLGKQSNSTAGGIVESPIYCIDILLPNNVAANNFIVQEVELIDCDLLIGMDIISHGDFSISNHDGTTKFTFRIPSIEHSDYVKEYDELHKNLSE